MKHLGSTNHLFDLEASTMILLFKLPLKGEAERPIKVSGINCTPLGYTSVSACERDSFTCP